MLKLGAKADLYPLFLSGASLKNPVIQGKPICGPSFGIAIACRDRHRRAWPMQIGNRIAVATDTTPQGTSFPTPDVDLPGGPCFSDLSGQRRTLAPPAALQGASPVGATMAVATSVAVDRSKRRSTSVRANARAVPAPWLVMQRPETTTDRWAWLASGS